MTDIRFVIIKYQYLELQSYGNDWFKELYDNLLINRFNCKIFNCLKKNYNTIDKESILIDIVTLNNKEFIKMLAYINTDKKY